MITKLKWIGTVLGIVGATLIAFNFSLSGLGFICFLISSVMWIIVSVAMNEHSLFYLNLAYFFVDILGIYRWII